MELGFENGKSKTLLASGETIESHSINYEDEPLLDSITSLISRAKALRYDSNVDKATRYKIRTAALALADACEEPVEQAIRIVYESSPPTVALRIALEAGFLGLLKSGKTVTASQLSRKTDVDRALIIRIMRVLAASRMIEEVDVDSYMANDLTLAFLQPGIGDAVRHSCDNVNVVFAKLPDYLINTDFREPTNSKLSPHAFALGQPLWNRMALEPRRSKIFDNFMTAFKKNRENWVDFFPFNEEFGEHLTEDETLIVDVAGGVGHRLRDFKIKYPKTTGKAVLQDLGYVLPTADRDPENFAGLQESGIELMEYDYSKVQPIYGARYYYFSAIFHGKSDSACLEVLRNTTPAMKKDYSRILISEFVIPDKGANLFQASMDLWMMAEVSGKERTERDWASLLAKVNLRIINIHRSGTDSVIEIELAE